MVRTVVAFERDDSRERITQMLERSGIEVRFRCKSGAEVIRAVRLMGSGVVVCGYKLADMSAQQLAQELRGTAYFLVLAKAPQLELCDGPEILKLPLPVTAGELRGSVSVLTQLDTMNLRGGQRSQEEKELIARAKEYLMRERGMSEEAAHRYLQRRSMETATKMAEVAKSLLGGAQGQG